MAAHTEDEIYDFIDKFPELDSSGRLSYTIDVKHFGRTLFNSYVQKVIVCTMIWRPDEWNGTKLKPVIYELLDLGKKFLTIAMIGAVARFIKDQDQRCRRDNPGGRNAESVYWESIIRYSRQYEEAADSIIARRLESASTSTEDPNFEKIPKADTLHYDRLTYLADTNEIKYTYGKPNGKTINHRLPKDSQKLIMCTLLYLGWTTPMIVIPVGVLYELQNVWTGPIIGQIARYIYDRSLNPRQTHAESIHWTTILASDPAWKRYAKDFDRKTSKFPEGQKPAVEPVLPVSAPQTVDSSSGPVANPYGNTHSPPPQPMTSRQQSPSFKQPYVPYADPYYRPPPTKQYDDFATYGSAVQSQWQGGQAAAKSSYSGTPMTKAENSLREMSLSPPRPLPSYQTGHPRSTAGGSGTRRLPNRDELNRLNSLPQNNPYPGSASQAVVQRGRDPSRNNPYPGPTSQAVVQSMRDPSPEPETGIIQEHHKRYITVEYARYLREHYNGIPKDVVESGFEMDSRNPVHEWDIPEEHYGLPMPLLDEDGLLDMEFDDPFFESHKRARDSASMSESPERGASASPASGANQGEVTSGGSHKPQGSSGHSSRKGEPRREHTKQPQKKKGKHQ